MDNHQITALQQEINRYKAAASSLEDYMMNLIHKQLAEVKSAADGLLILRNRAGDQLVEAQKENARLKTILADSDLPCIYCHLPKDDWGKCEHGFPGCSRADDASLPNQDEIDAFLGKGSD